MLKRANPAAKRCVVILILAIFFLSGVALAYQTDEELKKKYASVLGAYEFDATVYGMGVFSVEVYVEYGSLWTFPDISDSAAEMTAVEGEEFSFLIEDPNEGNYKIEFLKDDQGKYTRCHVVNEFAGMDLIGTKIK